LGENRGILEYRKNKKQNKIKERKYEEENEDMNNVGH